MDQFKSLQKTFTAMGHDFVVSLLAFYFSFALRLGELKPNLVESETFVPLLLLVAFSQTATFYFNGLYSGLWRYSSTPDLIRVIRASVMAVLVSFLVAFFYTRLEQVPRSVFLINGCLLILGLGGGRLLYRVTRDYLQYGSNGSKDKSGVLIVGAGSGGERLLREIKRDNSLNLCVKGFVDDSPALQRKKLHDVPVLGKTEDLPYLIKDLKVNKVLFAIPSATGRELKRIYDLIKDIPDLQIKTLPTMGDILDGKVEFTKLEEIKIEDLLGRDEVQLDLESLKEMLQGKKVLVTGAGGSIGSELCRQLAGFSPELLIALDLSEYNTYEIDYALKNQHPSLNFQAIVGDVRDYSFMSHIFKKYQPEVVLHAAAYKHVPLMEFNPYQAIQTNVLGTKNIAELSIQNKVTRFVLISTDKAVNPTNLMGASKRVAEMVVENLHAKLPNDCVTKMVSVRFGNVLGSSGSVIPLFRRQIKAGGPLTVTHPEITRFFMSIPEASRLVLQAGALGSGGELFVLDMGQPVKIFDMAKEMIHLSGLEEGVDIEIKFTGLRPGEKLYEEPLMKLELALSTPHPKVKVCRSRSVQEDFHHKLETLLNLNSHSRYDYVEIISDIVPEYQVFNEEEKSEQRIH